MTISIRLFITVASLAAVYGCANNDLGDVPTDISCDASNPVSFEDEIRPIVNASCAIPDCHNGSLGVDLDWRDDATFKEHAVEAARRVRLPQSDGDHMPASGSITDAEIAAIVCWSEQGAPIDN